MTLEKRVRVPEEADRLLFVLASCLANGTGEDRMLSRILLRMLSFRPSVSELTPDRTPADTSRLFGKVSRGRAGVGT